MIEYQYLFHEMKTVSVLFVEDYAPLRKEMGEILGDICKEVVIAKEGKEALDYYQRAKEQDKSFDLIISDIQMPVMNGVELSKKIREMDEAQPIIILSAYSDSVYLVELINIGISKFLSKPINHDELCEVLYTESKKINTYKKEYTMKESVVNLNEGFTWHSEIKVLKHNDKMIDLTKHELILLECFLKHREHICTNKMIIEDFYSYGIDMSEKNIRNLVFKLRKRVSSKSIISVYGLGYKFMSAVY